MKISQYSLNKNVSNSKNIAFMSRKHYSTSSRKDHSITNLNLPEPVYILNNLADKSNVLSQRNILSNKAGIYCFINKLNDKQYIGSAKDLYIRMNEHLSNRKSNTALQAAIIKYGLNNFNFYVYEYFSYENKLTSKKLLTDLETSYIKKFNFNRLYNFMYSATSLTGYKHTELAKKKMSDRFIDKENHPFLGKHHDHDTKLLISKPGVLNPMYGKTHTDKTKQLMKLSKKKYSNGVGIYDLNNNLVKSFDYATDMADYLKVSKVTVGKYINKGLIHNKVYYLKVNPTK